MAMGAWCGVYAVFHQGLYYGLSSVDSKLDVPQPKYYGTSLRRISVARVVALTHAVVSWVWAMVVLKKGHFLSSGASASSLFRYDLANGRVERAFMRHSLGYFIQELGHVLVFEPDPIFIAHHILYLASTFPICALSSKGWPLIAVATALAEVTNPLQLSWEMAKAFGNMDLYDKLSLPFTVAFTVCRGILMPIFMVDMARCIFLDDLKDSKALTWTYALFVAGLCASLLWLSNLIAGFLRYRAKKRDAQQKQQKRR